MIERKYNLNICLAVAVAAVSIVLVLGTLQRQHGIFAGADATAIAVANVLRASSLLTYTMKAVTFLGDEMGLTIFICIVYWLGYTTEAVAFLLMLLFGGIANTRMKNFFELARPSEIEWLVHADGYGYPSGHTMTGMLYAWLIYSFVRRYWYLCLLAAPLMAASRIYLGVHYFSDTVGGLLSGFAVVAAGAGIYCHVRDLKSARESINKSPALKVALALALSAVYLILARGLDGDFNYAGLLAGFFIVYPMLGFRWKPKNPLLAPVAIVLGLIVLLGIRVGLKAILPEGGPSDYFRYVVVGSFLAGSPLAFVKMGLYKKMEPSE